jgi:hypothetical protein
MALHLSTTQFGDKLLVYAGNDVGDPVAIIDHIVLGIEASTWSIYIWKYQDDFYFGDGRVDTGWTGLMFEYPWHGGSAKAHATA